MSINYKEVFQTTCPPTLTFIQAFWLCGTCSIPHLTIFQINDEINQGQSDNKVETRIEERKKIEYTETYR